MNIMRGVVLTTLLITLSVGTAHADIIHLKNGNKVEGIILESRDGDLTVKLDIGMVMSFSRSEIASVERSDVKEIEAIEQSWKEKSAQPKEGLTRMRPPVKETSGAQKRAPSKINWIDDYGRGIARAKSAGKPVMIDFYTDWCGWCKKLDSDTYKDKEVLLLSMRFICIKIDGDDRKDLVKKYKVRGYPTILFLGPDGKEIGRLPGFLPARPFAQQMKNFLK
ncbi:MAG: thioredoxin family protein [Candidatus Omnitrophota bacterium]